MVIASLELGDFEYEADKEGLLGMVWKGTVVYRVMLSIILNQYHLSDQPRGILGGFI